MIIASVSLSLDEKVLITIIYCMGNVSASVKNCKL